MTESTPPNHSREKSRCRNTLSTAFPSTHTLAVVEDVFSVAEYSVCAGSAIHDVFACRVVVGEEKVVSASSVKWTCVGSVDCLRLRTVRGEENIATNEPDLPTGISPRSYPAG
jgi:hypothetical protein